MNIDPSEPWAHKYPSLWSHLSPFQTINGSFEGVVDCKEVPCINNTQRNPKHVSLKPLLQEINTWCTTKVLT